MAKPKQGDNMDNQEAKLDPAKGVKAAENEFPPTPINDGGEDGQRFVDPAKLAQQSNDAGAEAGDDDPERNERAFVRYVNDELRPVADKLGFDLKLTKRESRPGTVMLYDPETHEGKVFNSALEAPSDWLSGDQLNELRAHAAAQREKNKR